MASKKRVIEFRKNSKKFSLNEFVYENFRLALKSVVKVKKYIVFSLILFLIFGIFGYVFPQLFEKQVLELIKQLIEQTKGLGGVELIKFIIYNNIKSAFIGLIFGVFFAFVPIGILLVNGYVIGFVARKTVELKNIFILWKLFPHGIFEIPAILISIATGIRLGMFLFVYHGRNKGKEFWKWVKDAIRVFIFVIIPLLVIAGIIEGLLISWLG